eukprot:2357173-Amphidinium_carterae.1
MQAPFSVPLVPSYTQDNPQCMEKSLISYGELQWNTASSLAALTSVLASCSEVTQLAITNHGMCHVWVCMRKCARACCWRACVTLSVCVCVSEKRHLASRVLRSHRGMDT